MLSQTVKEKTGEVLKTAPVLFESRERLFFVAMRKFYTCRPVLTLPGEITLKQLENFNPCSLKASETASTFSSNDKPDRRMRPRRLSLNALP